MSTITTKCAHINALDLTPMIDHISNERDPLTISSGWPREVALAIAEQYKAFLYILKVYPKELIVPFREVDEFWHAHILHTEKYHKDCETVFGHYVHHVPHKQKTDEDLAFYEVHYNQTLDLILKEFPGIE